ncbi:MAG: twin-arginine translocation signal domain-containing protein [Alphaproteobacteria bacterium]|nr:MAG: twin-arginine translocation signal domain-containing protein [Alphaproteobacteria bacterium]
MPKISRRSFMRGSAAGAGGLLSLQYCQSSLAEMVEKAAQPYRKSENLYRQKWTWDRVVRGTHGTNCAGTCAFNIYVKNGIVWREEQQGMYEASGDTPDYGPRGCQKGLRHAKYMYGKQRVLYPMKRIGERGAGKWERITWDQATREIAERFLHHSVESGPSTISFGSGTQMGTKLASAAAHARFCNITGVTVPEFFSGVGDLPTGSYITLGQVYTGDTMASIYKARCVLIWMANPAVTRIPDAHFFWEAKYNGTEIITIAPDFNATAMHSSLWVNPKPGTDTALAMAIVHVLLDENLYDEEYIKEQSDMPFLVRMDTMEMLRAEHLNILDMLAVKDNVFYMWDEATQSIVQAPGTGMSDPPIGRDRRKWESIALGDIRPALEGRWTVDTLDGEVEVTTVFELLKQRAAEHKPEDMAKICGVHENVIRRIAHEVAKAKPMMIYTGYAATKWLHGDILQRAMLLILSLTGSIGIEGGGLQFGNAPKARGITGYAFAGVGAALRIISATQWDYEHGNMRELNERIYGKELAKEFDDAYWYSVGKKYFPDYGKSGWKMGIFAGNNGANWRASGTRWRDTAFGQLDSIVTLTPDMSVTAHYSDYVLPIAHHYERADMVLQARTPYLHVLDRAVHPLGDSVDDFIAFGRILKAVSELAEEKGTAAFQDDVDGNTIRRDPRRYYKLYTMNGRVRDTREICQFIINTTPGIPKMSFKELTSKGIIRLEGSESTAWEDNASPYHSEIFESVKDKRPYETLTGRQQFYVDHEWFLKYDEALPNHKDPLSNKGFPLRMMMGHARHGIHSMWRDDPFLLSLQRGEPDIYINPDDAVARDVKDGDVVKVFNDAGRFFVQAHVSSSMQPGMIFMYHGWDPMMFRGRENFSSVISTGGLIKPTTMAGDYGHLGHQPLKFAPNQTFKDFTCDFALATVEEIEELAA